MKSILFLILFGVLSFSCSPSANAQAASDQWIIIPGRDGDSQWRYVTKEQLPIWSKTVFDDSKWIKAAAPFGTEVPGGIPKTPWTTSEIYLRREFEITSVPKGLSLVIHHDEEVEVYINGVRVYLAVGFLTEYETITLSAKATAALKPGKNIIAVLCHQIEGGQFIDLGLKPSDPIKAR